MFDGKIDDDKKNKKKKEKHQKERIVEEERCDSVSSCIDRCRNCAKLKKKWKHC